MDRNDRYHELTLYIVDKNSWKLVESNSLKQTLSKPYLH
jgi:hypothetical protein